MISNNRPISNHSSVASNASDSSMSTNSSESSESSSSSHLPPGSRYFFSAAGAVSPTYQDNGELDLSHTKVSYVWAVRLTVPPRSYSQLAQPQTIQSMLDDYNHSYPKTLFLMPVEPNRLPRSRIQPDGTEVVDGDVFGWSFNKLDVGDHSFQDEAPRDEHTQYDRSAPTFIERFASRSLGHEIETSENEEIDSLQLALNPSNLRNQRNAIFQKFEGLSHSESLTTLGSMRSEAVNSLQTGFDFLQIGEAIRTVGQEYGYEFSPEQESELGEMIAQTLFGAARQLHALNEVADALAPRQPDNVRSTSQANNLDVEEGR